MRPVADANRPDAVEPRLRVDDTAVGEHEVEGVLGCDREPGLQSVTRRRARPRRLRRRPTARAARDMAGSRRIAERTGMYDPAIEVDGVGGVPAPCWTRGGDATRPCGEPDKQWAACRDGGAPDRQRERDDSDHIGWMVAPSWHTRCTASQSSVVIVWIRRATLMRPVSAQRQVHDAEQPPFRSRVAP